MQLPLEDIKILDLSHALAGPFCSTMLGDFGAQVVKVEVPGAGDIARGWGPPFYKTETAYSAQTGNPPPSATPRENPERSVHMTAHYPPP